MTNINFISTIKDSDIAIIAMSGRFPGAKNVDEFWHNLSNGVESIRQLSDAELLAAGVSSELLQNPHYIKACSPLDNIELFDASFFGFNPKEAEILDPQHRLFLECAHEVLEQAGYNPHTYAGSIGVYAGAGASQYFLKHLFPNPTLQQSISTYQMRLATDSDFLPTRTAYKLNLTGPAVNIQTACSTSLVSVHIACQSLLNGECDLALAGGVSIATTLSGYLYQEGMILSPDGHCRAFDAQAQGTIGGSGVGIVLLKLAKDAIADRDYIQGIIKGSAINNDGLNKVGFTSPSVEGQAAVIAEAQSIADIDAETITYIETHGTGTTLGDPIEIAALNLAFRQSTTKQHFCGIGSLKTNVGHLDTAAGVAGLIKTILAMQHQEIPASLHFENPNPAIDFADSPCYVNNRRSPWTSTNSPRRAGVSSFGIGGTNAHVIVEEAVREKNRKPGQRKPELIVVSGKTDSALENVKQNLAKHLQEHPDLDLADVAYTLAVGRQGFDYRQVFLGEDLTEVITALNSQSGWTGYTKSANPSVIFMFSGQGSQYVNMGRELYETEPVFQEWIDTCAEFLQPKLGLDLRDIIYPCADLTPEQITAIETKLQQTAIAQPTIFTVEYALTKLWESWGIKPAGLIGHSIGEYVAACIAGVFDLKDALGLVVERGKLMQQLPTGAMLSVPLSPAEIEPFLGGELADKLAIAAINEPSRCVISGESDAIATLEAKLINQGIESRRLVTSHAFHSQMMNPILPEFTQIVQQITLHPPQIPYISNLTGNWITPTEATDPAYWSRHLRSTVQFAKGLTLLSENSDYIFLEIGAGRTLSTFAQRHRSKDNQAQVFTSLRHPQERRSDRTLILSSLGQLWLAGVTVDWDSFYGEQERYRIPLPTYPFERQRYWVEAAGVECSSALKQTRDSEALRRNRGSQLNKRNLADWFYLPSWKRSLLPVRTETVNSTWLVFIDEASFGEQLGEKLQQIGQKVISVMRGDTFAVQGDSYIINPQQPEDYDRLLQKLQDLEISPNHIVHTWCVGMGQVDPHLSFYSLLFLAQAWGRIGFSHECNLSVIADGLWEIAGEELVPEKAILLGAIHVIPYEYPHIICRSIDVVLPGLNRQKGQLIDQLIVELQASSPAVAIAYRGNHRWVREFEQVQLESLPDRALPLKQGGVYVVTGGLGGIGVTLAEFLAKTVQGKLILIGRSQFLDRQHWQQWLDTHHQQDETSQKIQRLQALETFGAKVLVLQADVANLEQMQQAIAQVLSKFGQIHGVIHAAGVPAGGAIQLKTTEAISRIFAPKIDGTLVLDRVFQDVNLDWLVLCSSLNAMQGTFGQIDYCAANAFQDAFAHYRTNKTGKLTLAINWDAWQDVGMAARSLQPQSERSAWIKPDEGIEVFRRILSQKSPQILVSTRELFVQTTSVLEAAKILGIPQTQTNQYTRPQLQTPYMPPGNPLEEAITMVWQEFLGIEKIGIDDNFLELGGDSLLATQLVARLRAQFAVNLSLASMFELPTIALMTEYIANQSNAARLLLGNDQSSDYEEFTF
ncbi:SDR family NAD(P)-dependent oxidoreductase [Cuspidothrix issatschenkoi LEGE 03284]|uniref:type I polyketide synthase n=1 Tax=Cuspidothrix issatschenkoi TaxID=230752 RepID=UPI00188110C4|nr:type I polyketide synthase [Cuspidothrix issatschenkoi]MBE9230400.1 SDR family NAD(P)-dependent oxidoreductase [Cuspidothrix issatschenkoi LEGE 03284]